MLERADRLLDGPGLVPLSSQGGNQPGDPVGGVAKESRNANGFADHVGDRDPFRRWSGQRHNRGGCVAIGGDRGGGNPFARDLALQLFVFQPLAAAPV